MELTYNKNKESIWVMCAYWLEKKMNCGVNCWLQLTFSKKEIISVLTKLEAMQHAGRLSKNVTEKFSNPKNT